MFRVVNNKGFQIDFENGFQVSVMFGNGNYCDNRDSCEDVGYGNQNACENAEIAVFYDDDTIYASNGGEYPYYGGWNSPDDIAKIIGVVASFNRETSTEDARQLINYTYKRNRGNKIDDSYDNHCQ